MPVEIENSDFVMKLLNCRIHLILKIHYLKFPPSFYQKKIAKVQIWCLLNPEYARVMFQEGLQNIYSKYELYYHFQLHNNLMRVMEFRDVHKWFDLPTHPPTQFPNSTIDENIFYWNEPTTYHALPLLVYRASK